MMRSKDVIFQIALILIFGAFMLVCFYPFYYVVINSISDNSQVDLGRVLWIPTGIHISNYIYVLRMPTIQNGAIVSVLRTLLGMLATVLCVSHMAYLFSKREMPLHKLLYRFVIVTMYFGAGLIPYYLTIRLLGLFNTFWVYIVPGLVPVYYMVLIKTYIESIPLSLEESAMIDGAGYYKRFIRIIIPLCKPILATIALFCMVSQWNSFMDTLLYITDYKLYTLQYLLYQMINNTASIQTLAEFGEFQDKSQMLTSTTVMLTVTVIITFPIICVYPFVQKYFVKGIMIGAVKG